MGDGRADPPHALPHRAYGVRILKLDNPGAGSRYYVGEGGLGLVSSPEAAGIMSQADARSLLLSTPLHALMLTLDGVTESEVCKF